MRFKVLVHKEQSYDEILMCTLFSSFFFFFFFFFFPPLFFFLFLLLVIHSLFKFCDCSYWYENGCLYPDMGTIFIAIDKCDKENGCLKVCSTYKESGDMFVHFGKSDV